MYYVIETRAYHVSRSTELFPQHCQLPNLTPHQHLQALTDKLTQATTLTNQTTKGRQLIKYLDHKIERLLYPIPVLEEQRVAEASQLQVLAEEQRVIDNTPIITILRIIDLPTTFM
jgi:hypothetical protein